MKLPNGQAAIIDRATLIEYCLKSEHPRGKHTSACPGLRLESQQNRLKSCILHSQQRHGEDRTYALASLRKEDLIRLHRNPLERVA